ncbi:chitin biosynthesis protein Chs5p [[Candida] railenensis]|uniref:Chitin biosynthesis protein CHS5 n=1 Tax=[Candida] railenensis TaxID=45579 RepID=A0A9P0QUQ7_9ASCO|nr:chitin biosynthesis protein Chs5p [[Candida] railenensis]
MVEVSLTVGKLDASLALLLTKDHHLIEFPTILLPNGVKAGSIISIKCDQDFETEEKEAKQFQQIQDEILNTFGQNLPQAPVLKIKNVTQTSCVLEWEPLELGTANLKNLILFKDGKKLGAIPQPLTSRTTKLSGLPIDKTFKFQLRFDTTAGVYTSDEIEVTTHKMTDLSGITVCLGDIQPNDQFTVDDIQESLKNMGAHYPTQDKIKVDSTHFICTRENKQNPEFLKASEMNIPIVRPEWLKACEKERRIVGVRDFYVKDCVLPDLFAKNYWGAKKRSIPTIVEPQPEHASGAAEVKEEAKAEPVAEAVSEPVSEPVAQPVAESISVAIEPAAEPAVEEKEGEKEIQEEKVPVTESSKEDDFKEVDLADTPTEDTSEPAAKQEELLEEIVSKEVTTEEEIKDGVIANLEEESKKEVEEEKTAVDVPVNGSEVPVPQFEQALPELPKSEQELPELPTTEKEEPVATEQELPVVPEVVKEEVAPESEKVDEEGKEDEDEEQDEGEEAEGTEGAKADPSTSSKKNKKKKKKGKK